MNFFFFDFLQVLSQNIFAFLNIFVLVLFEFSSYEDEFLSPSLSVLLPWTKCFPSKSFLCNSALSSKCMWWWTWQFLSSKFLVTLQPAVHSIYNLLDKKKVKSIRILLYLNTFFSGKQKLRKCEKKTSKAVPFPRYRNNKDCQFSRIPHIHMYVYNNNNNSKAVHPRLFLWDSPRPISDFHVNLQVFIKLFFETLLN